MLTRKQLANRKQTKARKLRRKMLCDMGLCSQCGLDKPAGEARWEWCTACAVTAAGKRASKKQPYTSIDKAALHDCAIRWKAGERLAGGELVTRLRPYINGLTRWFPKGVFGRDDATQELTILALETAKLWEPTRGASLMTFIINGHWQYILERLSLDVRYVARLQIQHIVQANSIVNIDDGNADSTVDAACVADTRVIVRRPIFLDSDEGATLIDYDMADSAPSAEEMLIEYEALSPMRALINNTECPSRIDWIARQRFFVDDPMTLDAIGKSLGITRERVRQIELAILNKLKLMFGVDVEPAKIGNDGLTVAQRRDRVRNAKMKLIRKQRRTTVTVTT